MKRTRQLICCILLPQKKRYPIRLTTNRCGWVFPKVLWWQLASKSSLCLWCWIDIYYHYFRSLLSASNNNYKPVDSLLSFDYFKNPKEGSDSFFQKQISNHHIFVFYGFRFEIWFNFIVRNFWKIAWNLFYVTLFTTRREFSSESKEFIDSLTAGLTSESSTGKQT